MDDRKAKKIAGGQSKSKSPRAFQCHLDQLVKHKSSSSRSKATFERSRSRSHTREPKRRQREESPAHHHHSPADRRQRIPSSQHKISYKATRHHSPLPSDSHRRFDTFQEETPSRVLGVFGLSFYTDERVLKEVFAQYGPVEDIQVILDHHSQVSRGFAFVYMRHLHDAIQAKELAPGTEIDGRKIRVDYSVTDFSPSPNAAGYLGRPVHSQPYQSPPDLYHRSARRSPPPYSLHDRLRGNGSRNYRGRSRSYSPCRF